MPQINLKNGWKRAQKRNKLKKHKAHDKSIKGVQLTRGRPFCLSAQKV